MAAPQDKVLQTLMVRSAATPRVSNHEATGGGAEHAEPYFSPTLNGGSLPGGTDSSAIASIIATMT